MPKRPAAKLMPRRKITTGKQSLDNCQGTRQEPLQEEETPRCTSSKFFHVLTLYVSLSFHCVSHSSFHTPGISIRSMCIGACHACTAWLCDLRDPGWGDPGFRHRVFFAWHPKVHPVMLTVFLFVFTMDDLLRTGHTSCLVITFQVVFDGSFHVWLRCFCLLLWLVVLLFWFLFLFVFLVE